MNCNVIMHQDSSRDFDLQKSKARVLRPIVSSVFSPSSLSSLLHPVPLVSPSPPLTSCLPSFIPPSEEATCALLHSLGWG